MPTTLHGSCPCLRLLTVSELPNWDVAFFWITEKWTQRLWLGSSRFAKYVIIQVNHFVEMHFVTDHYLPAPFINITSNYIISTILIIKGRGHTKETGNRNANAISENSYQPLLNTCNWMEQRKLR
jgi:hypothetical protein